MIEWLITIITDGFENSGMLDAGSLLELMSAGFSRRLIDQTDSHMCVFPCVYIFIAWIKITSREEQERRE